MPHEIVSFDDEAIKGYVGRLVAKTIEETIKALLDEEADQLVNADRYERTDGARPTGAATTGAGWSRVPARWSSA